MPKFKYAKLRAKIKEKYGTEGEFAKALNTSQVSVSRRFNGKTQFTSEDIKAWCLLLEIPVADSGLYFFA